MIYLEHMPPSPSSGIHNEYLNKNDDIYKPQVSVTVSFTWYWHEWCRISARESYHDGVLKGGGGVRF